MYALDGLSECSVQEIFQNLPDPHVLAQEIADNLRAALG
jgi:hypothetical protein